MRQLLDARGLACPLPAIKAQAALAALPAGRDAIVLATDPEAPVDIGALAADAGLRVPRRTRGRGVAVDPRQRLRLAVPEFLRPGLVLYRRQKGGTP